MSDLNGGTHAPNQEIVQALENYLGLAKQGRLIGLAVVAVIDHSDNWTVVVAGDGISGMHVGAGLIQRHIEGVATAPKKVSPIFRPLTLS